MESTSFLSPLVKSLFDIENKPALAVGVAAVVLVTALAVRCLRQRQKDQDVKKSTVQATAMVQTPSATQPIATSQKLAAAVQSSPATQSTVINTKLAYAQAHGTCAHPGGIHNMDAYLVAADVAEAASERDAKGDGSYRARLTAQQSARGFTPVLNELLQRTGKAN